MRRTANSILGFSLSLAVAALSLGAGPLFGQEAAKTQETAKTRQAAKTVATGLNGPMGVLVTPDGSVWVIDTGTGGDQEVAMVHPMTGDSVTARYGETARIVRASPDGALVDIAALPSLLVGPGEAAGGSRLAMLDGVLYATIGAFSTEKLGSMGSIVKVEGERATVVADIWQLESDLNPDGHLVESNPYGLRAGPEGRLWMTDAAGNTLLTFDPATSRTEVVAVFDPVPSPIPRPDRDGAMVTDAVPTGVSFGRDGSIYVSLLAGFPFVPGSSRVVRVDSNGNVVDYATGMTMLTDLRTGPDEELYAVSFGRFTEHGPVPGTGAILRIEEGTGSVEVLSGLSMPTSIDFNAAGDAFVTVNGMGEPGSGEVVVFERLASPSGS